MHLFVPRSAREELKALGPEFKKAYNVSNREGAGQRRRAGGWAGAACCIVVGVCERHAMYFGSMCVEHGVSSRSRRAVDVAASTKVTNIRNTGTLLLVQYLSPMTPYILFRSVGTKRNAKAESLEPAV